MTEPAPLSSAEPSSTPAPSSDWIRWALLVLSVICAAGLWLAWNTQKKVQSLELELVRRQQDSQGQATEARVLARQAQDVARETAARAALLEARLSEVTLQRSQVEELIKSMSLSRDENLVADIQAAMYVAIQQSSLTGSAEPLVSAMKTAEDRLSHVQQPRLDPIRRALAKDQDKLRATRVADLSALTIRLDEAIRMVDELPLISQAVDDSGRAHHKSARIASANPKTDTPQPKPETQTVGEQLIEWGRVALKTAWQEAQSLVRITRIRQPESILIAPDQAFFVRENLKLRLLNARLALMSRQAPSAVADLNVAQAALSKYFDKQSRKTQLLQSLLNDVITQCPQTSVPRPDDTLAALAAIAGGR